MDQKKVMNDVDALPFQMGMTIGEMRPGPGGRGMSRRVLLRRVLDALITIDGEEYEYTGTNHRVLLFKAYADANLQADAFRYLGAAVGITLFVVIATHTGAVPVV